MNSTAQRLLVIHAGTHKTASSYIQSRIAVNANQLAKSGVLVRYPASAALKHKPLASALAKRRWPIWKRFLRKQPADTSMLLLSAEQFTQPLTKKRSLKALVEMLRSEGWRLQVLLFLRDQPDYINARYVHSTRRLYHHQDFYSYVTDQLAERRHIYDYNYMFTGLLQSPAITCTFLPYGSIFGDPFERMMATLGVQVPVGGWLPADSSKGNVQPGCQGVWLAQAIGERLDQLGIRGKSLVNAGAVVRRIAEQQGWQDDRYCGFDTAGAGAVAAHYAQANDEFAQRVWGCNWRERMPELQMKRRQFNSAEEAGGADSLEKLVQQAMKFLARHNQPLDLAMRSSALTMESINSSVC